MRATATLLATLAMSLTALGLAIAAPGGDDQDVRVALASAGGAVRITNSKEGQAVLNASAMRPGQGVSGTLRIGNAGDERGLFAVRPLALQDVPGEYGGMLSQHVELVLFDVTNVQAPKTVFAGRPAEFGQVVLGTIAPGAHREYLVAMTLPDSADNRFQGSSLTLGLEWLARPEPVATATPNPPTAPATPTPVTPTPTPARPITAELGLPSARACMSRRRFSIRLKAPKGTRVKSATIAINGKVKARVKGGRTRAPVNLRGLPKGKVTVKVTVRASNGKTYVSKRTYRTCATAKAKKKAPRRGKRR
jgi:hypothetical protein